LSKEVLLRKSDELSGSLRSFFESVKNYLRENKDESFYAKPIREKLRMNPMQANRYLSELEQRGYIKQTGGNRKTGFEYSVKVWDDYEQLKKGINILDEVLEKLRANEETRVAKNGKHNSKKIEKAEV
jgi:DNA primase